DVIFGGTDLAKATGFARVDLVLNNERSFVPIDFAEFSVGRSLFRTGESEYRLNNNICRRKDITGLFLDTGVGTDGYSVMEQGRISQIINAKPSDRRAIFDEAAGIARYKLNKEEALRKLERTKTDLERLTDVISEVQRQVNSLKRQAGKAARYRRIDTDLKRVEAMRLTRLWLDLKSASAGIELECQKLGERVKELTASRDAADEMLAKLHIASDSATAELEDSQAEQYSVNTSINDAKSRLALAHQREKSEKEQLESLTQEITQLEAEEATLTQTVATHRKAIEEHAAMLTVLEEDCATKNNELAAFKLTADETTKSITNLRISIRDKQMAKGEMESTVNVSLAMKERLQQELAGDSNELENLKQELKNANENADAKKKSVAEARKTLENKKQTQAMITTSLVAIDAQLKQIVGELDNVRKNAQGAESKYQALSDLQENYEGYYRGVREVMTASKAGSLPGLCGVVSELVTVTEKHELAIEIALGARAQDIVASTADDAKKAIEFLKRHEFGRATFLSLDIIRPRGNDDKLAKYKGQPGVIGLATELVKYDKQYEKAVQYLLGGVLVVENLNVAIKLSREGLQTKIVTLQGDMIDPHGAMTGGSVKSSGLLYRTRQVRDLKELAIKLTSRVNSLEKKADELRKSRGEKREENITVGDEVTKCTIELNRLSTDSEALDRIVREKTSALEHLHSHRAQITDEIKKHETNREQCLGQVVVLTEELELLTKQLKEAEVSAESEQKKKAQFQTEVHNAIVRLSTEREKSNALKERHENARRELIRVTETQTRRVAEINNTREQLSSIAKDIVDADNTIVELGKTISKLDDAIKSNLASRNQLQENLRKAQEDLAKINRDLNSAINEQTDYELRSQEYTVNLRNLEINAADRLDGQKLDDIVMSVIAKLDDTNYDANMVEVDEAEQNVDEDDEKVEERALQQALSQMKTETTQDDATQSYKVNLNEIDVDTLREKLSPADVLGAEVRGLRDKIARLGIINMGAIDDYSSQTERLSFLKTQFDDMGKASKQLTQTIAEIDTTSSELFTNAFAQIRENFQNCYRKLFGGGNADLILTEENGILDSGIDIIARPPGKKPSNISLLSGGEQAMTAISLMFGIFMYKPSPFCILDEIDAPLDDKNIERFKEMLKQFSNTTQFIIITHNKSTMTLANTIYGVTMQERGVSRVVSIKLDEYDENSFAM
ncbi:MAG: hypothetical protein PHX74_03100, partial [Candidatus Sumerlaeales bacterium]|nr:hypothetical protein [Candidatus Sumerlaeales bacterium]